MESWDERQNKGCLIHVDIGLLVKRNIFLQIMMRDVDFFVKNFSENTKYDLEVKERRGMYPPRFHVIFRCSPSARENQTRIEFRGAVTNLVYDIFLTPAVTSPSLRSSAPTSPSRLYHSHACLIPANSANVIILTCFHFFSLNWRGGGMHW